jgi:hypothetical protein
MGDDLYCVSTGPDISNLIGAAVGHRPFVAVTQHRLRWSVAVAQ